jgi:hypothetical protein
VVNGDGLVAKTSMTARTVQYSFSRVQKSVVFNSSVEISKAREVLVISCAGFARPILGFWRFFRLEGRNSKAEASPNGVNYIIINTADHLSYLPSWAWCTRWSAKSRGSISLNPHYEPGRLSLWNSGHFQGLKSPATGLQNPDLYKKLHDS